MSIRRAESPDIALPAKRARSDSFQIRPILPLEYSPLERTRSAHALASRTPLPRAASPRPLPRPRPETLASLAPPNDDDEAEPDPESAGSENEPDRKRVDDVVRIADIVAYALHPEPSVEHAERMLRAIDAQVEPKLSPLRPEDRFSNIRPYRNRSLLCSRASSIAIAGSPAAYVATQAPLRRGFRDFLSMVRHPDLDARTIVSLVSETELDTADTGKSMLVWPYWKARGPYFTAEGVRAHFRDAPPDLAARARAWGGEAALLEFEDGRPPVRFLRYSRWPDMGSPPEDEVRAVADLLREIGPEPERPVAIHCKAGVGRTGALIAAHAMWASAMRIARGGDGPTPYALPESVKLAHPVVPCRHCGSLRTRACDSCKAPYDIVRVVAEMRSQRTSMMQRGSQVAFAAAVARELGTRSHA